MNVARLGDHAKFLSGFAFKSKFFNDDGTGLPVVRIRDVVRGHSETFYSGEYDERYIVSRGEYLIGMDGEFNLARWQSEEALLNQRVCKIDSICDDVDRGYLGRFLPVALKEIEDATPFVTVKHLSVKTLNEIQIPLPPLAEQKRIAGILDAADALRAKRRESLAQLDTLLQSTFLEMFGDPVTNPMGWEVSTIGEVTTCLDRLRKPIRADERTDGEIPYYGANGQQGWINEAIFDEALVLVAEDGGHFEAPERGVAYRIDGPAWVNNHAHVLRPSDAVEVEYLHRALRHYDFGPYISGSTRAKLNQKQLNKVRLLLPPLDLQHRFAAIVESVEQQKASQRAHLEELDTLFASLQSRAFQGEL